MVEVWPILALWLCELHWHQPEISRYSASRALILFSVVREIFATYWECSMPQWQKTNAVSTFHSNPMYTEQKFSSAKKNKVNYVRWNFIMQVDYISMKKFDFLSSWPGSSSMLQMPWYFSNSTVLGNQLLSCTWSIITVPKKSR